MYIAIIFVVFAVLTFLLLWGKRDSSEIVENFAEVKEIIESERPNREVNVFSNRNIEIMKLNYTPPKHSVDETTMEDIAKMYPNENTLFDDPLYSDKYDDPYSQTTYYKKYEGDENSGINKCSKECKGNCVEFGLTGNAWCFNPIETSPS